MNILKRIFGSTGNRESKRPFKHSWEFEYSIDEGVYFNITATLELYYEPAIDKYVVSERGADTSVGRHWNKTRRPDATFSSYPDALREYMRLANYYAPRKLAEQIRVEIEEELSRWSKNDAIC